MNRCFFLSFPSLLKGWSWHLIPYVRNRLSRFHRAIPSTFLDKCLIRTGAKVKMHFSILQLFFLQRESFEPLSRSILPRRITIFPLILWYFKAIFLAYVLCSKKIIPRRKFSMFHSCLLMLFHVYSGKGTTILELRIAWRCRV